MYFIPSRKSKDRKKLRPNGRQQSHDLEGQAVAWDARRGDSEEVYIRWVEETKLGNLKAWGLES